MPDKETGASAGGLLSYLHEAFGSRKKKPTEAPAVEAVVPANTPTLPVEVTVSAPESTPTMTPQPSSTEAPTPTVAPPTQKEELPDWLSASSPAESVKAPSLEENELPDWLRGPYYTEPAQAPLPEAPEAQVVETPAVTVEAPMPAPEVPADLPAIEAPAVPLEAKAESDPFATSREFNGHMETIRQAQAVLANGIALTLEEQRKALIAVARSNSLLPKLPSEVFKSVLLMRAVAANNPNFGRDDFQLEMLAAMNIIKTGVAIKG